VAHVGSSEDDVEIAEAIGARGGCPHVQTFDLAGYKIQIAHHIGCSSQLKSKGSAMFRLMAELFEEKGRWGADHPGMAIRGHSHEAACISVPCKRGMCKVACAPSWQLHVDYSHRLSFSHKAVQIGALLIEATPWGLTCVEKVETLLCENGTNLPSSFP